MESVIVVLMALAVAVGLFVIFRAFILWYWQVSEALDVLKSMDAKLAELVKGPQPPAAG